MAQDRAIHKGLFSPEQILQFKVGTASTLITIGVAAATKGDPWVLVPAIAGVSATIGTPDVLHWWREHADQIRHTFHRGGKVEEEDAYQYTPSQEIEDIVITPASEKVRTAKGDQIERLTIDEIVNMVEHNSFKVSIGRSLSTYEPVIISFFKKHIKLIGSSQKGKSSMAAALLEAITRTHDVSRVLLALIDFEDMTSKLFAHLPHIAEVAMNGGAIPLIARTREQCLEYLGYIVEVVHQRYEMTKLEIKNEPLLIVYLEEFLALKDYFKKLIQVAKTAEEKAQAQANYTNFVFYISEIARLGLKARVQLLMCAQVDYRDDDLQEALINVTNGFSFAVRPSAAQAAGFMDYDLLARNAKDNKVGQAVVETSDCHDLVLAPEFDLEARLEAFEERELEQERLSGVKRVKSTRSTFLTPINGHRELVEEVATVAPPIEKVTTAFTLEQIMAFIAQQQPAAIPAQQEMKPVPPTPIIPEKRRSAEEIPLTDAIKVWNVGVNTKRGLMDFFDITDNQAYKLMGFIKSQANVIAEASDE